MTRQKPLDQELQDISNDILYEIQLLIKIAYRLPVLWHNNMTETEDDARDSAEVTWNVHLESFLIHARNLIQFLYVAPKKYDDVVASDFFDDDMTWSTLCPPQTDLLKTIYGDAHKRVAHLTYTRLQRQASWQTPQVTNDIMVAIRCFLENVPDSKISDDFKLYRDDQLGI